MTIKAQKIIKRLFLGILLSAGLVFVLAFTIHYFVSMRTVFDQPSHLTGEIKTIEVSYINWACDCADFIETKYFKDNPDYESKEEDCIFIEPANPTLKVPDSFYSNYHFEKNLRLTGQFYKNKGIPKSYEQKTPEKPNHSKVFRYDKIEIVNNDK